MHIFFSGIGGTGIGPLALIAHKAGFDVSGSDKQQSQYTDYLQKHGVKLHIGQTNEQIDAINTNKPIDWFVYSSALPLENPNHPELEYVKNHGIKYSKRDECLKMILDQKKLKLIAVAGTHGKTTTTAMLVWLFKKLEVPISYSVGAKISFGDMGEYYDESQYFIYECDEFDRNFLSYEPYHSAITVVDWDHHEIFPTRQDYKDAFRQFIGQSATTTIFERDAKYLQLAEDTNLNIVPDQDSLVEKIKLPGLHVRQNATIAINTVMKVLSCDANKLVDIIETYPGSSRRFEKIANNLFSDYAHTPEEVAATIQMAKEISDDLIVIYEPLTDRRQHFTKDLYEDVFNDAAKVYWLPSYLAREDSNSTIIKPQQLLAGIANKNSEVSKKSPELKSIITNHLKQGSTVLCLAGGGGGSLDEWIRKNFK